MPRTRLPTEAELGAPRPKLLIAEDDVDMAFVIEFLMRREGYDVEVVADGRRAVERVRLGNPVDLLILDMMMPFVSGQQVLRTARTTAGWESVPVLVVSGKSSEADVVAALEGGATDYLTKPFRPKEFVARVSGLLTRRSAVAQVA